MKSRIVLVTGLVLVCLLSACVKKAPVNQQSDYTIGTVVEVRDFGRTIVFEDLDSQGPHVLLTSDFDLKVGDHVDYEYTSERGPVVRNVLSEAKYQEWLEFHNIE